MKGMNHEQVARVLAVILAAMAADPGSPEYAAGCAELSSLLRAAGLPPLAADPPPPLEATATIPPAGAVAAAGAPGWLDPNRPGLWPVAAPALGHNPLSDDRQADEAADDATEALARVGSALRRLALASAATANVRGDLCGAQWAELAQVLRDVLGGEPEVTPAAAVTAAVGDGPSVDWLRSQWEAARVKGDDGLANWYAAQASRHGARFQ